MGLLHWAEKKTKAMSIWDIGLLKWCCILVGMIIGACLSGFIVQNLGWFIAATGLLLFILLVRIFKPKG